MHGNYSWCLNMPVNSNKPERWKSDISRSVDFYNEWFINYAPKTYRDVRIKATEQVETSLKLTDNLMNITPNMLKSTPSVLKILRMATAPPLARDRLINLSKTKKSLVERMEIDNQISPRMSSALVDEQLQRICEMFSQLADIDIFPWLINMVPPDQVDVHRAATIVADRLCGSEVDPMIRNEQENRQLTCIKKWLEIRGYDHIETRDHAKFDKMEPGTFTFRLNVPGKIKGENGESNVNIPVDVVIMPLESKKGDLPLLIEAKSAGDFTNVNKRRKEEATKLTQLKNAYGDGLKYILLLGGYFDAGYLGYEAAEGIDWIWEHRIEDLIELGV